MPTLPVLEMLEQDLAKPVISSASAMMWQALRLAGVEQSIPGYGRLLALGSRVASAQDWRQTENFISGRQNLDARYCLPTSI